MVISELDKLQTVDEKLENGETLTKEDIDEYLSRPDVQRKIAAMHTPWIRAEKKIGMNEPCPCGSGKKYKKCCYISNMPKYILKGENND